MGNRCPDCNKFVSLDVAEPEAEQPEVNGDDVSVDVRVVQICAECNGEIKEWNATLEEVLNDEATIHKEENPDDDKHVIEAEWQQDPEVEDFYRPREEPKPNKKGVIKPVPLRFQTHYYKVSGAIDLSCSCGKSLGSIQVESEIESSSFDDLT